MILYFLGSGGGGIGNKIILLLLPYHLYKVLWGVDGLTIRGGWVPEIFMLSNLPQCLGARRSKLLCEIVVANANINGVTRPHYAEIYIY